VTVDVDGQGRMRPDAMPEIDEPAIVCTQAGNVNTGAFDPIAEICARVKGRNAWVHVDDAFGLWAAASPGHAWLCAGMENADSWATDAHKWLNVPYDCGIAFVRDTGALKAAMAVDAAYLITESAGPTLRILRRSSHAGRAAWMCGHWALTGFQWPGTIADRIELFASPWIIRKMLRRWP
jgi:glutamate/tyrosine decarboxylase-like PLP-dependent enzyme